MAIQFTASSSEGLKSAQSAVTAAPFTWSLWFYPDSSSSVMAPLTMMPDGHANDRYQIKLKTNNQAEYHIRSSGSNENSTTSNTFSDTAWNHVAVIETAADDHKIILNGDTGDQGTNTDSKTVSGVDSFALGYRPKDTPDHYFDGRLAEVGIWNVALNAGELAALADGISCYQIRPSSLKLYTPGVSSTQELIQPYSWTVAGSPSIGFTDTPIYRRPRVRNILPAGSDMIISDFYRDLSLSIH